MISKSSLLTKENYAIISLCIRYNLRDDFMILKSILREVSKNNFDASEHLSGTNLF